VLLNNIEGMNDMKYRMRTPNMKQSNKAKTSRRVKRAIKSAINPLYGKKGTGLIHDAKRTAYNRIYKKATFSFWDFFKKGKKSR